MSSGLTGGDVGGSVGLPSPSTFPPAIALVDDSLTVPRTPLVPLATEVLHNMDKSSEISCAENTDIELLDEDGFVDPRRGKRRRSSDSLPTTPPGRDFQEGLTVLFAPKNSDKVSKFHLVELSKFLDSAAPAAVKEVRLNTSRNLVAVDAATPRLKGLLLQLTTLCSTPVRAFLPRQLLSSDGLIRVVELDLPDDEILKCLTSPFPVRQVKRLGASSPLVKITFNNASLPTSVKIGHVIIPVFPFKERALQCYHCFRFGHIASACDSPKLCSRCGASHEGSCAAASPFCVNCGKDHDASSSSCQMRQRETAISRYKHDHHVTHREARVAVHQAAMSSLVNKQTPSGKQFRLREEDFPQLPASDRTARISRPPADSYAGNSWLSTLGKLSMALLVPSHHREPTSLGAPAASPAAAPASPAAAPALAAARETAPGLEPSMSSSQDRSSNATGSSCPSLAAKVVSFVFMAIRSTINVLPQSDFRKVLECLLSFEPVIGKLF